MELAMTLPILGLVLLALFEFSLLFSARGTVVEASRAAARVASLQGSDMEDVQEEVTRILGPRYADRVQVDVDFGQHSGDTVCVGVSVPMDSASPDLLWPVGYGLEGRRLYSETCMVKE